MYSKQMNKQRKPMCYILLFPQQRIIAIPPLVAMAVAALTAEVASVVVVQEPDILAARVQQVRFSISIIEPRHEIANIVAF